MRFAYVDTSWLVAIAFGETGADRAARTLERYDRLFSSNLLEAELRAAFARENVEPGPEPLLSGVTWVFPAEALSAEYDRLLEHGRLRGADLYHLAAALSLERQLGPMDLLSFDQRQREVAAAVGLGLA